MLCLLVSLFLLSGLAGVSQAAENEIGMTQIRAVKMNPMGLERVNAERIRQGMQTLDESFASPPGQDTSGSLEDAQPEFAPLPPQVDNSLLGSFPVKRHQNIPSDCYGDDCFRVVDAPCDIYTEGRVYKSGACQPFSEIYYTFTHNFNLYNYIIDGTEIDNKTEDNSTKFSPRWMIAFAARSIGSGISYMDIYPILQTHGVATWQECPFTDNAKTWNTEPDVWLNALSRRMERAEYVDNTDTENGMHLLKQMLANGYGLVIFTCSAGREWTHFSDDPSTEADDDLVGTYVIAFTRSYGGHAMSLIGYNDDVWTDINHNGVVDPGEKGAFKVAESSFYGDGDNSGFRWFSYDSVRFLTSVSGWSPPSNRRPAFKLWDGRVHHLVVGNRHNYEPRVIAKVAVNSQIRSHLKMTLGISDFSRSEPQQTWQPYMFNGLYNNYYFRNLAFDGTEEAGDYTFVLDCTDLVEANPEADGRFYLIFEDMLGGHPSTLNDFRVINLETQEEMVYTGGPHTVDRQQITVHVDSSVSEGEPYYVQYAVNTASPGDEIIVIPGTYYGPVNFNGKNLTLRSTDPNDPAVVATTIINGGDRDSTIIFDGTEDESCVLTGFTITDGYADFDGSNRGGGICGKGTHATISKCVIENNLCDRTGGGIANVFGTISNCLIRDNTSNTSGGGLADCQGKIINCVIADNLATAELRELNDGGGALHNCNGKIINCTIAGNTGVDCGALRRCDAKIVNCIIRGNSEPTFFESAEPDYSCCPTGTNGTGNIYTAPCFVDAENRDYHLLSTGWRWDAQRRVWTWDNMTSRCIDAGNPGANLQDEPMSLDVDPSNLYGINVRINMGAYGGTAEASIGPCGWSLCGDITNDGIIDSDDLSEQLIDWLQSEDEQWSDLNRDGTVNLADLALLANEWLEETLWR